MWLAAALGLLLAWQSNFYTQGLKALDEKRYQEAVEAFTNAVAAEPGEFTTHFNLALALSLTGKDAEAAAEYRKTLELKPGLYQAQLNLGILLMRMKQPEAAREQLAAAAAQKPTEFRPNYYLGDAQLNLGHFAESAAAFTAALAATPNSAAAELGLGRALARQNKLDEAAPHFQKAATLDPKFHDALLELASLYESARRYQEAADLYGQFPSDPAAQEHRGEMLLAAGNTAAAVAQFESAVAASPSTANRAALADAYIANHQPDRAFPIIQQLLQTDPNNFELVMLSGKILRDQRKFPAAVAEFQKATQLRGDSPQAWGELADMLVLVDDDAGALGALDRVRALNAEKPGHVYLRAIVLDKMHDIKPALAAYQQFLSMSHNQYPDEEFKARQRARILQDQLNRR
jgi:tetratricopeptide (TPR) repeat protein